MAGASVSRSGAAAGQQDSAEPQSSESEAASEQAGQNADGERQGEAARAIGYLDDDAKTTMSVAMAEYSAKNSAHLDADEEAQGKDPDAPPIVRLANTIIQQAIKEQASDVHIEPERRGTRIRFRIDGVLHEVMLMPKFIEAPLIQRYRVMADFDLARHRGKPQQGTIDLVYLEKRHSVRVTATPTIYSDKLNFKIFDHDLVMRGVNKLGFTPEAQAGLEWLAQEPSGLVLFAGPHGSGRSTTQYALLNKLNGIDEHLLTIEPYSSYRLSGVTQVELSRTPRLSYRDVWSSARDVDVLHIERVLDLETADLALSAAESGAVVFAAIDASDAVSALARMTEFGVSRTRIGRALNGILAHRLVRKVCGHCAERYEVDGVELRRFGYRPRVAGTMVELTRGIGCENCRNTGFQGRSGMYELLRLNREIAEMVERDAPLRRLEEAAKADGLMTLREDGLVKVLEGVTTPDEVMRVLDWNRC